MIKRRKEEREDGERKGKEGGRNEEGGKRN